MGHAQRVRINSCYWVDANRGTKPCRSDCTWLVRRQCSTAISLNLSCDVFPVSCVQVVALKRSEAVLRAKLQAVLKVSDALTVTQHTLRRAADQSAAATTQRPTNTDSPATTSTAPAQASSKGAHNAHGSHGAHSGAVGQGVHGPHGTAANASTGGGGVEGGYVGSVGADAFIGGLMHQVSRLRAQLTVQCKDMGRLRDQLLEAQEVRTIKHTHTHTQCSHTQ